MRYIKPAVAAGTHQHPGGADAAAGGLHAGDLAVFGVDGGGFGLLVDVHAVFGAPLGQAPDNGVMAHDAAGRMVHGPVDGKGDIFGDVQCRHHLFGLFGIDQMALHAVELGRGDGHAGRLHGRLAVHEVQVAAVVEHEIEVQLLGEHRPKVQRLLVKRNVVLRPLVGPHDRRVSAGTAEPDEALFNDGNIREAVLLRQVVGRGEPVQAAADDHRIVAGLESGLAAPQGLGFPEHTFSLHGYELESEWVK
jgi:hypothetical protein